MSGTRNVLIAGGGIVGLFTAYYALQRGHRVTLVDRDDPGHAGCSHGNAGMVVPSHFTPLAAPGMVNTGLRMLCDPESPFWIRPRLSMDLLSWLWKFARSATAAHVARSAPLLRDLHLASRGCYEELSDRTGLEIGLVRRGLLMLCKSEHALKEEARVAVEARRLGLEAEVLNPEQTAECDPGAQMDVVGAVYFKQDCHLVPERLMTALTDLVKSQGARLRLSTEITGWRVRDGRVAGARTAQDEDLTADEFVLAGGAWSGTLARALGLRLPLQAGKGYSLTLERPPQLPQLCSILTEARVAVTPMGCALRFAGTLEITGNDLSIDPRRVAGMRKAIPRYLPDFSAESLTGPIWSGLRPCSPDGLPYLGRSRRFSNLTIATGHAMMGISLGPITGKLAAELLSGETPSLPLSLLSPDRFG